MSLRAKRSSAARLCIAIVLLAAVATVHAAPQSNSNPAPTRSTRSPQLMIPASAFEEKLSQIRANQDEMHALVKKALVQLGYAKTRATIR